MMDPIYAPVQSWDPNTMDNDTLTLSFYTDGVYIVSEDTDQNIGEIRKEWKARGLSHVKFVRKGYVILSNRDGSREVHVTRSTEI